MIKTYNLDSNEALGHGAPIFLSSANNWILTRLVDVKIFAQLLKGQNDKFIKGSIEKQRKEFKKELAVIKKEIVTTTAKEHALRLERKAK